MADLYYWLKRPTESTERQWNIKCEMKLTLILNSLLIEKDGNVCVPKLCYP